MIEALLGAIVGGLVSLGTTLAVERRREVAVGRASARILGVELSQAETMIEAALTQDHWWPDKENLPSEAWAKHREPVARLMKDEKEWRTLEDAFREIERIRQLRTPFIHVVGGRAPDPLDEDARRTLGDAKNSVFRATEVLAGFPRSRIPFLR